VIFSRFAVLPESQAPPALPELRLRMAMLTDAAALLAGERVGQHRAVEGQRLWIEAATLDR
jgi:hypothetical protein